MLARFVSICALAAMGCSSSGSSFAMNDGGDADTITTDSGSGQRQGCAKQREAELEGTLDGTTVDQTYTASGSSFAGGGYNGRFGTSVFVGTPPGHLSVILGTSALTNAGSPIVKGTLRMPKEGPRPGEVFCVGGGVLARPNRAYTFTLTNLSKASEGDAGTTCLEPIEGEIRGCIRGAD